MAQLDPRGAPDYSHYDYAAESVRMYKQGKREGAADKADGKEPNAYLYRVASPDYSHAKGYREGYGECIDVDGRMNVATYDDYFVGSPIVAQQQCGGDDWEVEDKDPLEVARLIRNIYADFSLPIAVRHAGLIIERDYRRTI